MELINLVSENVEDRIQILLPGSPSERGRNEKIISSVKRSVFDGGCDNPLRHFTGLIGHCRVVFPGDSLAMHMALAMRCRVAALFGPTSSAEIDLFS